MNLREEVLKNSGLLVEMPVVRTIKRKTRGLVAKRKTEGLIMVGGTIVRNGKPFDDVFCEIEIPNNVTINYNTATEDQLTAFVLKSKPDNFSFSGYIYRDDINKIKEMDIDILETEEDGIGGDFDDPKVVKITKRENMVAIFKKLLAVKGL